jgi:F-type H+-transporting ATPase subunit epsilon
MAGDAVTAAAVHGGFVQMNGEKLVVLSDLAELRDDIDVPRAEAAKEAAEAALASDPDDLDAKAALARAETRLKVAGVA